MQRIPGQRIILCIPHVCSAVPVSVSAPVRLVRRQEQFACVDVAGGCRAAQCLVTLHTFRRQLCFFLRHGQLAAAVHLRRRRQAYVTCTGLAAASSRVARLAPHQRLRMTSLFGTGAGAGAGSAGGGFARSQSFTSGQPSNPTFSFGGGQQSGAPNNSLFGKPGGTGAGQPSGSGLFGSSSQPSGQPSSGGIFGNQPKPAGTGGLFGQPSGSQPSGQPSTGGGLFGQQSSQPGGQQPSGGVFGQSSAGQSGTQQPSGSLFGQSSNQQQAGGLFGQSSNLQQSGGLFGKPAGQQPSGGLFGQSATQPSSGGLFGQSSSQPQGQQPGGLFGQSTSQPSGGGLFGSQPPAQAAPAPPLLQHPFYQRERFNDLPEAQRRMVEEVEKYIASQTQIQSQLRARGPSGEIQQLMAEAHELDSLLQSLEGSLEADTICLQSATTKVDQDRNDNVVLHEIAQHARDHISDGSGFVHWLQRCVNNPSEHLANRSSFYERAAEEFVGRIHRYRATMEVRDCSSALLR